MLKIDFKKAEGLHVGGCLFTAPDLQSLFLREIKGFDGKLRFLLFSDVLKQKNSKKRIVFMPTLGNYKKVI